MREIDITIAPEKPLLVYGPAKIKLLEGEAHIYGKEIEDEVEVSQYKALPVETDNKARLTIEYTVRKPEMKDEGLIGTRVWREEVNRFLDDYGDILILGGTDSGKTSLTVYIANKAFSRGITPSIADYDPGQGDIGIPSFIGGGIVQNKIFSVEEVDGIAYGFIGSTTPMGLEEILIKESEEIYRKLRDKTDFVIMNYHGWVRGLRAFHSIVEFIEKLRIKKVLVIGNKKLYRNFTVFNEVYGENIELFYVEKPETTVRNRTVRKMIRERKYREFIEKTKFREALLDLSLILKEKYGRIRMQMNSKVLKEILVNDFGIDRNPDFIFAIKGLIKIYYYSDNVEKVIYRTYSDSVDIPIEIYVIPRAFLGILSGVKYNGNWVPGICKKVDFNNMKIHMLVPSDIGNSDNIKEVRIGRVAIDLSGREKGLLKKDIF